MTHRERVTVTIVVVGVAAGFGLFALTLSGAAGRLPILVSVGTVVLGLVQWSRDRHASRAAVSTSSAREAWLCWTATAMLGGLYLLGFLTALPIGAAAYWRWVLRAGWATSLAAATGVLAFLYLGVALALGVELYAGVLWDALAR